MGHMSAPAQRRTAWLLLLAFLFAILAPVASQATGSSQGAQTLLIQLCSREGPRLVAVDLSHDSTASDAVPATDHGGFCLLCVSPGTPPGDGLAVFQPAVFPSVPKVTLDEPAPRFATVWRASLARAPPAQA